jgi:hypothetical protein
MHPPWGAIALVFIIMAFMIYFRRLRGSPMPMTISITPAMEKKLSCSSL